MKQSLSIYGSRTKYCIENFKAKNKKKKILNKKKYVIEKYKTVRQNFILKKINNR